MKRFSKGSLFYSLVSGFVFGIFFRSFFDFGSPAILLGFLISAGVLILGFLFSKDKAKINTKIILTAIFILSFSFGVFRFHISDLNKGDPYLNQSLGQRVEVFGMIAVEPEIGEKNQKLIVRVNKIKILVTAEKFDKFEYGENIKLKGVLSKPENFTTSNGKVFDYVSYLRKDDIFYEANYPKIEVISKGDGNRLISFLYRIKNSFLEKISKEINEPESSLLGGILLGGKHAMNADLKNDFIKTGVIHIVALSGFNVTIVAEAVAGFFSLFFRRKISFYFGIFSIILFALMTGGGSTILRASIMAGLAFVARATGRTYDVTRALCLALLIMLIQNPWILVYDVSFQLSFLATIGIIYVTPHIEKYFKWAPKTFDLQNIFASTMATYLFVLPFVVYKMGTLSFVALPVNFIVLPFIPGLMLLGFLTSIFGFLNHFLALPFAYLSFFLLRGIILIAHFFAGLSFSSININYLPLVTVVTIYLFYIYLWFRPKAEKQSKPEPLENSPQ